MATRFFRMGSGLQAVMAGAVAALASSGASALHSDVHVRTAATSAGAAGTIMLDGNAVYVLSSNESTAVNMALTDLQTDFYGVFGYAPVVLGEPPAAGSLAPGTCVVYLGSAAAASWLTSLVPGQCISGWESHCVAAGASGPGGYPFIAATGAGVRGAIYGAYAFAEEVLGVNPWGVWADDSATQHFLGVGAAVAVNASLLISYAPPVFTYRGWFINDEDLLGGAFASPTGEAVADMRVWNDVFEAALRLKVNTVIVGTVPYPDESSIALAARRGLVVTDHHFNLCGINTFRWPLGSADWDWDANPMTMAEAFKASIAAQSQYEMVWSLGLRGLNDYPYPCPSDKVCGRIISEAMANQSQWVHAVQPNADTITYLWAEGVNYYEEGVLKVPSGTNIVLTDSGTGYINGDNLFGIAHGVYYHTAMYDDAANQLTEMVPADRIFTQLGAFIKGANATVFFMDNISDLRPVLMTTEAVTRFVWDPTQFNGANANASAQAFYAAWAQRQLQLSAADAATFANIWWQYFLVPYVQGGMSDNRLAALLQQIATEAAPEIVKSGVPSAKTQSDAATAASEVGNAAATWTSLLSAATTLQASIPLHRQPFFTAHTLQQLNIHLYGCYAVTNLSAAITSLASRNNATAAAQLQAALASMDNLFAAQRAAQFGQWRNVYFYDRLADMQRARSALHQLLAAVQYSIVVPVRPSSYYQFTDYQIGSTNFPLLHYNATWNLLTYVRMACETTDLSGGACVNTADGGHYRTGGSVQPAVTMVVEASGASIVYTTDGSQPTPSSTQYTAPIDLGQFASSVTISAAPVQNGALIGKVVVANFTRW